MQKRINLFGIMLLLLMNSIEAQELKKIETILPFTNQFDTISVVVKNGVYIFNEDVVVKEIKKPKYYDELFGNNQEVIEQAVATSNRNSLWKYGEVPYKISSSMPNHKREEILEAINTLNKKTNLKIRPAQNETDYIFLRYNGDGGCNSYVGRIGGKQTINVAEWCGKGSVMHEFMHAVGFYHEQSRPDRDSYIRVNWGNISSSWRGQYQKVKYAKTIGEYDYNSIMHYPKNNGNFDCYKPCNNVGNREYLSSKDIIGINTLYPFNKKNPIEKKKLIPVSFYTNLAEDQIFENVIVKISNKSTTFSVSFKDEYELSYVRLEEGKKYKYEVFVECLEYKKENGSYVLFQRNGKGIGYFKAQKGLKLGLNSTRRSSSGRYTASFE